MRRRLSIPLLWLGACASPVATTPDKASAAAMLNPGDRAPLFAIPDETGKVRSLTDYAGKTVVLWFYPKADTPGCTAEGCGFRDLAAEFAKADAVLLGASLDTQAENAAFKRKFDFPFPLLCDTGRTLAIAYGAAADVDAKNAARAACVIGPDGKVKQWYAKVDAKTFPETVLQSLRGPR